MKVDLEYFKNNFFGYSGELLPVAFNEKRKIQSCDRCQGTGRTSREELTDYHKHEYETHFEDCQTCWGNGRVIVTEIFVSFGDAPYNQKINASSLRNIRLQTIVEEYTTANAKDIEHSSKTKLFQFALKDVIEHKYVLSR